MAAQFTSQSTEAAELASALFREWLAELPEGVLRSHVAELALSFRELDEQQLRLLVYHAEPGPLCLYGARMNGDHVEIVGPYVKKEFRRHGLGKASLTDAMRLCWSMPEVYLLALGNEPWRTDKLEREGFFACDSILPGGAGEHQTFLVSVERRAQDYLRLVREPRGRGSWAVVLHNDDDTTFEIVVAALMYALDVNDRIAFEYANLVHHCGQAVIRFCRTEWTAKRVARTIRNIAHGAGFPLYVDVERTGNGLV
ncbi:MAG: ATP-dependent Clp protease adaptor ClpS [Planctomycetes bacterium]|nr:ATP-dependent Clp protease adaptor ClpS [Planctomycetota bacterium]MCB9935155.1 ATP-dependent Clp protease adaptor ClpS [Planctomycetota bacterium]